MAYYYNILQPDAQDYQYFSSYNTIENAARTGYYGYVNYEYAIPQSSMIDYSYNNMNIAAATGNYGCGDYEYAMPQSSMTDYNYIDYISPYHNNHQPGYDNNAASDFTVGYTYSVSTHSYPNMIEYDPSVSVYSRVYSPAQTQSIISYSVSDFNEPEFSEYDPTPYGGGYDITKTYGKPLPPSEGICYPRSNMDPNAQVLGGQTAEKPQNGMKPTVPAAEVESEKTAELLENGSGGSGAIVLAAEEDKQHSEDDSDRYSQSDSESEEEMEENKVHQPHPVPDYRGGSYAEFGAREVPIPPPPPGYGLEAMDICESLFGYWPCLSRYQRECARQRAIDREVYCNNNWEVAADYLFGEQDPYAYGERRDYGSSLR